MAEEVELYTPAVLVVNIYSDVVLNGLNRYIPLCIEKRVVGAVMRAHIEVRSGIILTFFDHEVRHALGAETYVRNVQGSRQDNRSCGLRLFIRTSPEEATECSPIFLIGLLEVDVLILASVRSVHGIFVTHTIRIPSYDSVVLYLNHLDSLALCKSSSEFILTLSVRVSSEEEVSAQSSYVPAVLADEVETVSERRLNRRFGSFAFLTKNSEVSYINSGRAGITIDTDELCTCCALGDSKGSILRSHVRCNRLQVIREQNLTSGGSTFCVCTKVNAENCARGRSTESRYLKLIAGSECLIERNSYIIGTARETLVEFYRPVGFLSRSNNDIGVSTISGSSTTCLNSLGSRRLTAFTIPSVDGIHLRFFTAAGDVNTFTAVRAVSDVKFILSVLQFDVEIVAAINSYLVAVAVEGKAFNRIGIERNRPRSFVTCVIELAIIARLKLDMREVLGKAFVFASGFASKIGFTIYQNTITLSESKDCHKDSTKQRKEFLHDN